MSAIGQGSIMLGPAGGGTGGPAMGFVVIVPLMLPVAAVFGIDPVHLGIIFLANMELGYLTPPVGMNLYLASFRFEKPLMRVFRASLPFFLINLIAVLVITFVPAISVGVVQWFGL